MRDIKSMVIETYKNCLKRSTGFVHQWWKSRQSVRYLVTKQYAVNARVNVLTKTEILSLYAALSFTLLKIKTASIHFAN